MDTTEGDDLIAALGALLFTVALGIGVGSLAGVGGFLLALRHHNQRQGPR